MCIRDSYYSYEDSWSFLDTIFLSKDRNIKYIPQSIKVYSTPTNSYSDTGRPIKFNPKTKLGVSDHLPMVAKFILN